MRSMLTRQMCLLGLASLAHSVSPLERRDSSGAGYDTSRLGPDNANCQRQTYQLAVSSNNIVFQGVDSNANTTVVTSLFQDFLSSSTNFTQQYEAPNKQQVSNTYSLSGTLCTPKSGAKNAAHVQLLVHGVGFDSSYWDFVADGSEDYSYVRAAADAGYTTFRYDRLGTGLSEKPNDAYNVVQSPTDLAILTEFSQMLRSGAIGGQAFSKIVGVGHSYGSVQLQALTASAPTAIDAVLLQGFSKNGTAMPPFLAGGAYTTATYVFPDRFPTSELSNAYVVTGTPYSDQFNFFYFPYFSDGAFQRARATEQPATQGVLFSQTAIMGSADSFTGPVHVDSKYPNIPAYVKELYPAVKDFTTYIPANTG
ncbi:hypothetical protein EIP86_007780 [Pleurotus ostreatoroseus]|nr:hypothetical protein EIP86_007780 [Pleurotus ostreatoroseus]